MKLVKKLIISLIMVIPSYTLAYSDYIIASGSNIGIELNTKGITVIGLYKVGDNYPGKDAGIEVGDIITYIDDNKVSNVSDMVSKIQESLNDTIKIGYIRNNILEYTNLKLSKDNNIYKTGLYVRDSIAGIGTLTYIDPFTSNYGALGHEITDNLGNVVDISGGKIYESTVTGINKSRDGIPGGKNAKTNDNVIGKINENTIHGIFGKWTDEIVDDKLYKVAKPSDIKKGEAKILTVLDNNKVEEFSINILKIMNNSSTKNILFEITDTNLLNRTGGIVQGMSGSPIIQGEYIIGAVTHVIVENPNKGYGIFITNMLKEGEN